MGTFVLHAPIRIETRFGLVRMLALVLLALAIGPTSPATAHDTTLQVDGYSTGQTAAFQSGFIAGEIGAVRLTPPGPFPMQLKEVLFLFGGTAAQAQLVLRIYDDSAGTLTPGVELFSDTYLVDASNTVFQSVDLTAENILLNGAVRVGIEMVQGGLPSIARDNDGNINGSLNFIKSISGWDESQTFGLTGDWIIRAVVTDDPVPTLPVTWGQIKTMHGQ